MPGLPFERLPVTPESTLNEQIQTGRQQIQDKYALQWREVNRNRRSLGATKTAQMLRQIDTKAKQEMLQFNQQAQAQMAQLRRVDVLAQQGAITNPEEIKARMTFGPDVARSMYPEPQKERTIPQQFGELDVYSHRISQELERFKVVPEKKPSKALAALGFVSPAVGAVAAYRSLRKREPKQELQIWDLNIPAKVKGEDVMGDWRRAEPEEVGIYQAWLQEEKDVAARKRELLGMPSISRRIVQPGTAGGTFGDKIKESIRKPPAVRRPRQQPTAVELRRQGTREAYEEGKTLGYWR